AQQVEQVLKALGLPKGLKTALLVGGDPIPPQVRALQEGAQLVVATPGRVLDLVGQRFLSFPWTEFAVLDEADEMLEIGFLDDVNKILNLLPEERQTLLFSATFPPPLLKLARTHTNDPVELATAKGVSTVDRITQHVCEVDDTDKPHVLKRLLRSSSEDDLFLVFCDRRTEVDRVFRFLERTPDLQVKALHGGFDQASRFRVMSAFRAKEVRALIATDVASRGLDVSGVTHVVNYTPPRDISDYTHRIGRTGRAGATGHALTFVGRADKRKWRELVGRMAWEVPAVDERDLSRALLEPGDTREEDDRRRRSESEDDGSPRRERSRRRERDGAPEERPRHRSAAREDEDDERPARRRTRSGSDSDSERPRRTRRREAGAGREEEPRRRRRASEPESTDERPEQTRRRREPDDEGREASPRGQDDGRRRRREGRGESTREDDGGRPRRRRSREDSRRDAGPRTDEAPKRERARRAEPEATPESTHAESSFGAGIEPSSPSRSRRSTSPARPAAPDPPPSADAKSAPVDEDDGFGAGLLD
ncbi:MAG: DEAD/DEAH box helicase, partial [Planctomycetota bacterium]